MNNIEEGPAKGGTNPPPATVRPEPNGQRTAAWVCSVCRRGIAEHPETDQFVTVPKAEWERLNRSLNSIIATYQKGNQTYPQSTGHNLAIRREQLYNEVATQAAWLEFASIPHTRK